jgi:rhodanese-related sulfurtransferase
MLRTIPELISEIRSNIQTISAKEAYILAKKEPSLFIDVREPQEVAESPVNNSINLPRGVLEMNIGKCCQDEYHHIFLHCASGGRATFAAEQLLRLGFKNVWAIVCPHNDVCIAQKQS